MQSKIFRLLRRLLAESARTARTIKQLDFTSAFVQASVKQRLFVKIPICLNDYFPPTMTNYFGRPLKLAKGLYGTTHSARWWWKELHDWLIVNHFECAISENVYMF